MKMILTATPIWKAARGADISSTQKNPPMMRMTMADLQRLAPEDIERKWL
jgi:hypothetical protein